MGVVIDAWSWRKACIIDDLHLHLHLVWAICAAAELGKLITALLHAFHSSGLGAGLQTTIMTSRHCYLGLKESRGTRRGGGGGAVSAALP